MGVHIITLLLHIMHTVCVWRVVRCLEMVPSRYLQKDGLQKDPFGTSPLVDPFQKDPFRRIPPENGPFGGTYLLVPLFNTLFWGVLLNTQ